MTSFYAAYRTLFGEAEKILKNPLRSPSAINLAVEGLEHARRKLIDARDDDEQPPLLRRIAQEVGSHGTRR